MSYRMEDDRLLIGDTWHCSVDDTVHAFVLQFQKQGQPDAEKERGAIGHAISRDLLHWERLPLAVPRGPEGSYDDQDHYTGCTVYAAMRNLSYSGGSSGSLSFALCSGGI